MNKTKDHYTEEAERVAKVLALSPNVRKYCFPASLTTEEVVAQIMNIKEKERGRRYERKVK